MVHSSFDNRQFERFQNLIQERLGIHFNQNKREMLQAKLDKLMRKNGLSSYDAYFEQLTQASDPGVWVPFSDEITVNKTDFFREMNHFEFIRSRIDSILEQNRRIRARNEIRAWSAGCSTGQEPYTLAMVFRECLPPEINLKILATDISHRVLSTAQRAYYPPAIAGEVSSYHLQRYFQKRGSGYQVDPEIRRLVTFRQFNLMERFPFRDTLDIIFCRNVMIYFDQSTQQELIEKFYRALTPGGYLFIGHSESLTNKAHRFSYIQPTVYQKKSEKILS
jgi:chemotaxis protein methyltransferase CheR